MPLMSADQGRGHPIAAPTPNQGAAGDAQVDARDGSGGGANAGGGGNNEGGKGKRHGSRRRDRSRSRDEGSRRDREPSRSRSRRHRSRSPSRWRSGRGGRSRSPSRRSMRSNSRDRSRRDRDSRSPGRDRRGGHDTRDHDDGYHRQGASRQKGGVTGVDAKEVGRAVDRLRKKIAGKHPLPVHVGQSPGELSVQNSAVVLQQTVHAVLHNGDGGLLKLPIDRKVGGRWVTESDELTSRRRELLVDLLHEHLPTYRDMQDQLDVHVYRITGRVDVVPFDEVTTTDWLRLIVRHQGRSNGYEQFADAALSAIVLKPAESWASAAARVLIAFRAAHVDPARPHITEPLYFWRHITERQMKALFERVVTVLLPNVVDNVGVSSLLHMQFAEVDLKLEPLRIESHNPNSRRMVERGAVAQIVYLNFFKVLSVRQPSYATPVASGITSKPAKVSGPDQLFTMNAVNARHALRQLFHDPLSAIAAFQPPDIRFTEDQMRVSDTELNNIRRAAPHEHMTTNPQLTPVMAAFANRAATTPGQHGLPFVSSRAGADRSPPVRSPPTAPSAASTPVAPAPVPTAPAVTTPRETIYDFLRAQRACYSHAFSSCSRARCRWSHEVVPAGFYQAVARPSRAGAAAGGDGRRHRLAAMSEVQYDIAVHLGLTQPEEDVAGTTTPLAAIGQSDE